MWHGFVVPWPRTGAPHGWAHPTDGRTPLTGAPTIEGARVATKKAEGPQPTRNDIPADLFTEVSRAIDQHLWFVEAHLQK